jgi:hypothetical protein
MASYVACMLCSLCLSIASFSLMLDFSLIFAFRAICYSLCVCVCVCLYVCVCVCVYAFYNWDMVGHISMFVLVHWMIFIQWWNWLMLHFIPPMINPILYCISNLWIASACSYYLPNYLKWLKFYFRSCAVNCCIYKWMYISLIQITIWQLRKPHNSKIMTFTETLEQMDIMNILKEQLNTKKNKITWISYLALHKNMWMFKHLSSLKLFLHHRPDRKAMHTNGKILKKEICSEIQNY